MPPAVVAAGITGATTLGGALIGSGAQKSAQKHQARANQQAMQMEQQRLAEEKRRYDQSWSLYQQQLAAREATKRAIAKKYGIDLPEWAAAPAAAGPAAAPPGAPPGRPGLTPGNPLPGAPSFTGQPAYTPVRGNPSPEAAQGMIARAGLEAPAQEPMAGGPPSNWNDWSRYARLA